MKIDCLDHLNMSDEEKTQLPKPTLLLRWVDLEEIRKIRNHSWFNKVINMLRRGRVAVSLGLLSLELTVPDETFSRQDAEKFTLELFEKSRFFSHEDYQRKLSEQIQSRIFYPFLIVVKGKLHLVMYTPKVIRVLYDFLKDKMPNEKLPIINWDELDVYDGNAQQQIMAKLFSLASSISSKEYIEKLLIYKISNQKAYLRTNYKGIKYNHAILFGKIPGEKESLIEHHVLFPDEAVETVSKDLFIKGLPACVLGWVVHIRESVFMIRAIAFAEEQKFAIVTKRGKSLHQ